MLDAQYAAGPQAPALMWIPYPVNRFEGMEQFNHITQQRTSIQTVRCANCNHATALIIDQDNNPKPRQTDNEGRKPSAAAKNSAEKDPIAEPAYKAARASSTQPREHLWVEEDYEPTDPSYTPASRKQRGLPEADKESVIEVEIRSPIKQMSYGSRRTQSTPKLREAEEFELARKEPKARRNRSPSPENPVNGVSDSEDESIVDFDEMDALRKLLPHLVNCPHNETHPDCHMWTALRSISTHQLALYLAHNIREDGAPTDEIKIVANYLTRRKAELLGTSYIPYHKNKRAFEAHHIHVRTKRSSVAK